MTSFNVSCIPFYSWEIIRQTNFLKYIYSHVDLTTKNLCEKLVFAKIFVPDLKKVGYIYSKQFFMFDDTQIFNLRCWLFKLFSLVITIRKQNYKSDPQYNIFPMPNFIQQDIVNVLVKLIIIIDNLCHFDHCDSKKFDELFFDLIHLVFNSQQQTISCELEYLRREYLFIVLLLYLSPSRNVTVSMLYTKIYASPYKVDRLEEYVNEFERFLKKTNYIYNYKTINDSINSTCAATKLLENELFNQIHANFLIKSTYDDDIHVEAYDLFGLTPEAIESNIQQQLACRLTALKKMFTFIAGMSEQFECHLFSRSELKIFNSRSTILFKLSRLEVETVCSSSNSVIVEKKRHHHKFYIITTSRNSTNIDVFEIRIKNAHIFNIFTQKLTTITKNNMNNKNISIDYLNCFFSSVEDFLRFGNSSSSTVSESEILSMCLAPLTTLNTWEFIIIFEIIIVTLNFINTQVTLLFKVKKSLLSEIRFENRFTLPNSTHSKLSLLYVYWYNEMFQTHSLKYSFQTNWLSFPTTSDYVSENSYITLEVFNFLKKHFLFANKYIIIDSKPVFLNNLVVDPNLIHFECIQDKQNYFDKSTKQIINITIDDDNNDDGMINVDDLELLENDLFFN